MAFHRDEVLTGSRGDCLGRLSAAPIPAVSVFTSKVKRTRQSKAENWQHREQFLGLLGRNRHTFTAFSDASLQGLQVSGAWETGQSVLADVFLQHISIWTRNVRVGAACEHAGAQSCLYYLLPVFTQLLNMISLFN